MILRKSSTPLRPGICTSEITSANCRVARSFKASCVSATVTHSYCSLRAREKRVRMTSSSSTMRIRLSSASGNWFGKGVFGLPVRPKRDRRSWLIPQRRVRYGGAFRHTGMQRWRARPFLREQIATLVPVSVLETQSRPGAVTNSLRTTAELANILWSLSILLQLKFSNRHRRTIALSQGAG
jgi:hypothetical protein